RVALRFFFPELSLCCVVTDRKIETVAFADAHRAVSGCAPAVSRSRRRRKVRRRLVGRVLFLIAEEREDRGTMAALPFIFVRVLLAAMVACKFRDNVLAPSARRAASHSCVALRLQLSKRRLRGLNLPVKIHTTRRPAKRAPEQEHIFVAVGPVCIGLSAMKLRVGLTHVVFDAGKLILPGVRRAVCQLRLQLPATGVRGTEVRRRFARTAVSGLAIHGARRGLVVWRGAVAPSAAAPSPALGGAFICPGSDDSQGANDAETAKKSFHITRRRSKTALPGCS